MSSPPHVRVFQLRDFQQKRFERVVDFVDQCQTNFTKLKSNDDYCEWSDTVTIKIDVGATEEYTNKFGVNFLDKDTLIVGDEMNNVLLVYQDDGEIVTKNITPLIHVLNKLRLTPKCVVHKKVEPAKIPPHIKVNLNFIQNNIQNIQNADTIYNGDIIHKNFADLHISSPKQDTLQSYLETYFTKGGTIPIKQLSRHPEWKRAYRDSVTTRNMNICKSCDKRFLKGCCANYSRTNRTMRVMVIGWHEKQHE